MRRAIFLVLVCCIALGTWTGNAGAASESVPKGAYIWSGPDGDVWYKIIHFNNLFNYPIHQTLRWSLTLTRFGGHPILA